MFALDYRNLLKRTESFFSKLKVKYMRNLRSFTKYKYKTENYCFLLLVLNCYQLNVLNLIVGNFFTTSTKHAIALSTCCELQMLRFI